MVKILRGLLFTRIKFLGMVHFDGTEKENVLKSIPG